MPNPNNNDQHDRSDISHGSDQSPSQHGGSWNREGSMPGRTEGAANPSMSSQGNLGGVEGNLGGGVPGGARDDSGGTSGGEQPRKKQRRGFAAMDPAKQREIASKGGKASHEQGTGHEWDSESAREAGRKGGQASRGGRGKLRASEGGGTGGPTDGSPSGTGT